MTRHVINGELTALLDKQTTCVIMLDATKIPSWLVEYDFICLEVDPCTVIVDKTVSLIIKIKVPELVMGVWCIEEWVKVYRRACEEEPDRHPYEIVFGDMWQREHNKVW